MSSASAAILVFTRKPVTGQVKTRLIQALGESGARQLHEQLLVHTLQTANKLTGVDRFCYVTPDIQGPFFQQCTELSRIKLCLQQGADLGERMSNAIYTALQSYQYALVVGTDCPGLKVEDYLQVLEALDAGKDVVLIPAYDGGYVLIAMAGYYPELFTGIEWGTDQVLQQTLDRITELDLQSVCLTHKHDIDTQDDLQYCPAFLLEPLIEKL